MDASPALRVPVQSPPVWRHRTRRQGHQKGAGVEAAQCLNHPGWGDCNYPDGARVEDLHCAECCADGASSWLSYDIPPVHIDCVPPGSSSTITS